MPTSPLAPPVGGIDPRKLPPPQRGVEFVLFCLASVGALLHAYSHQIIRGIALSLLALLALLGVMTLGLPWPYADLLDAAVGGCAGVMVLGPLLSWLFFTLPGQRRRVAFARQWLLTLHEREGADISMRDALDDLDRQAADIRLREALDEMAHHSDAWRGRPRHSIEQGPDPEMDPEMDDDTDEQTPPTDAGASV